jgi:hypothetical protein
MKTWLAALVICLFWPYSPMDKFAALYKAVAADCTSPTFSSTALLFGTGLIGLICISRRF